MSYQLAQAIQTDANGYPLPPGQAAPAAVPAPAQVPAQAPAYAPAAIDPGTAAALTEAPPPVGAPIPDQAVNGIALAMMIGVVIVFFSVHIGVEVGRSKRYWSGPVWGIIAFCVLLMMLPTALGFVNWLGLPADVVAQWGWGQWIASTLAVSVISWITLQLVVKILPDDPPARVREQRGQ